MWGKSEQSILSVTKGAEVLFPLEVMEKTGEGKNITGFSLFQAPSRPERGLPSVRAPAPSSPASGYCTSAAPSGAGLALGARPNRAGCAAKINAPGCYSASSSGVNQGTIS